MRQLVNAALVAMALSAAACGGGSKPPMVPDSPDMTPTGDGGPDTPSTAAPAPPPKK